MSCFGDRGGYRLGPNRVANGLFNTNDEGWVLNYTSIQTIIENGSAKNEADDGASSLRFAYAFPTEIGKKYQAKATQSCTGIRTFFRVANDPNVQTPLATVTVEAGSGGNGVKLEFTATATTTYVGYRHASPFEGSTSFIDNVSAREMIFDDFILGPELAPPLLEVNWVLEDRVSIEDGVVIWDNILGTQSIHKYDFLTIGSLYQIEINVVDVTNGGFLIWCGNNGTAGALINSTRKIRQTLRCTENSYFLIRGSCAGVSGKVDFISVKKIIG